MNAPTFVRSAPFLLLLLLLLPGCSADDVAVELGDMASRADLAITLDLAPLPDLARPLPDLAMQDLATVHDLAMPDLSAPIDLAIPDFAIVSDMAAIPDLVVIHDLATSPDIAKAPDLAMIPDMAMIPVDMATIPDLTKAGPMSWPVTVAPQGALAFSPNNLTIAVGDTVTWTWMGNGHNVVSGVNGVADNKFCSPNNQNCFQAPTSNAGATYSFVFNAAGNFNYFCAPHAGAGMTGTITVK